MPPDTPSRPADGRPTRTPPAGAPEPDALIPLRTLDALPTSYRITPIADLIAYHQLGAPLGDYERARLLVGMCMDHRTQLRMPENFAYVLRSGGANFHRHEFKISFAIAVGGVEAIALIGHTDCGMVGLGDRREAFVEGLVARAGWSREEAERHFEQHAPAFEIPDAAGFVRAEAGRLRDRYRGVAVCPLLYRLGDHRLYLIREGPDPDVPGRE